LTEHTEYLIIGGGLAGGYAVQAIRRVDTQGRIILVTEENELPYDRVPLSKVYLVGRLSRESVFLKKSDFYSQERIEILFGTRASGLDLPGRSVSVSKPDGTTDLITFERLLLATGGRPRRLNIPGGDLQGVHYLRTLEECERIKSAAERARRAVVVGGGFIGCEVAASLTTKGIQTTVLELGPYLLNMAIDEETGRWVTEYLTRNGVSVMLGTSARRFVGEDEILTGVETSGDQTLEAELAVVGVGIQPNVELATAAGLRTDNGIVVDEYLETEVKGVFAAGDVARFYSPIFSKHLRLEHYDVASKQGRLVGANMAGQKHSFSDLPYFFSNLFGIRVNVYGDMSDRRKTIRRGVPDFEKGGGFMQFYMAENRINAFLEISRPLDEVQSCKKLVSSGKEIVDPSVLSEESYDLKQLVE